MVLGVGRVPHLHLSRDSESIAGLAGDEDTDSSGDGVDISRTDPGPSLFLRTL
jgi:hypothetical protein